MIIQRALLGRCEHTPGVTAHAIPEETARKLDQARITLADVDAPWCLHEAPHTVHVYDAELAR